MIFTIYEAILKKYEKKQRSEPIGMVKGVNKAIIEINLTESSLFERAILFVKPDKLPIGEKKLTRHAQEYIRVAELTHPSLPGIPPAQPSKRWHAIGRTLLQWGAAAAVGQPAVFLFFL